VAVIFAAAVAIALRIILMIGAAPALLTYPDERSYVHAAAAGLFANPFRPAGYSLFLRLVHLFSSNLFVTVGVQHLIGLATGIAAYALARRIGCGRWTALLPAVLIVWSGDQLYLEQILLSDGLFLTILVLTCYCALRVPAARGPALAPGLGWAVAAGVLAGALVTVRTIGVPVAGVVVIWLLVAGGSDWRRRLAVAGSAGLVCAAILVSYAFAQQSATGVFGLTRFSGWPLYGRVAPFADCRRFTPPPGTRGLCQATPACTRPGQLYYIWDPNSPAHRLFGPPPTDGGKLGAFARAAILGQPGDYLFVVGRDLVRFLDPQINPGADWSGGYGGVSLNERVPSIVAANLPSTRAYWGPVTVHTDTTIVNALERWRRIVRVHGWMLVLGLLFTVAGIARAPDRSTRRGLVLLLASALSILVGTALVAGYNYRYGIAPAALLMLAGSRGVEMIVTQPRRTRLWRRRVDRGSAAT
jgi:hypothetical protein